MGITKALGLLKKAAGVTQMSSPSIRDAFRAFTTTCALITVDGPRGPNVMAAEWTFNVSYRPFLIAVHVDKANVTHDEILATGEFGVNLVSEEQAAAMRFAGHFSKADTEKLSSRVFETYPARTIRAPMIRGSVLNAECRLVQHLTLGDHTAFIGEVLDFSVDPEARPLILHHGSHRLGEKVERRPGIVVAATPSRVRAGESVKIAAELATPLRGPLTIALRAADGTERPVGTQDAGGEDNLEATVTIPRDAPAGAHGLVVRAGGAQGDARLDVLRD
ncbi:MAG TPA: flavin reductase family protein [Thermoplasmata archaeon]|nr:flavin reductase family protein [Thermoplasmata archaeon]